MKLQEFLSKITLTSTIRIYTDGGCQKYTNIGGWGVVFYLDQYSAELSGSENDTTSNRMEMMAAAQALESLPPKLNITLLTDSTYLKDGITTWIHNWKKNGWLSYDKKPIKNRDLWERIDQAQKNHNVEWCWTRGGKNSGNERADRLVFKEMNRASRDLTLDDIKEAKKAFKKKCNDRYRKKDKD